MIMLLALLLSTGLVLFGIQLSIQSSYYADPTRWFCGTLDRMLARMNNAMNCIVRGINRLLPEKRKMREAPSDNLSIYQDVQQCWLRTVPIHNVKAQKRFDAQRREKLGE